MVVSFISFALFLVGSLVFLSDAAAATKFRCDYTYDNETSTYFKYQEIPATWHDARLRCSLEGAALASPLTPAIKDVMVELTATNKANCGIFTGVHATLSTGYYFSIDGVPISHIPHTWAKGEPDNEKGEEDCLIQLENGSMADVRCNETFPYVCFKKNDKRMIMTSCGTTDPEYNLDTNTGQCYKFHRIGRNWSRAFMTCAAEGGHLVIINSEKELQAVKDLYARNPTNTFKAEWTASVFVGFHNWDEHPNFLTIKGETLQDAGYDKFSGGEPNNAAPGQYCGAMYPNGLLDDMWCEKKLPFICEKSPDSLLCEQERR